MNIYVSTSNDPFYNLALEYWLFKAMLVDMSILYLWQNKPCVVIGRAQNPWRESNLNLLSNDNIPIIRRRSGGGAVYQDFGNLNYTIMAPKKFYDKRQNLETIVDVLQSIRIQTTVSLRNSLITHFKGRNYKISGSAFCVKKNKCFQHGTLLINTEINKLHQYLHHTIDTSLETTGVYSIRSKVINLSDIYPNLCVAKICQAFLNLYHHYITYLPNNLNQQLIIQEIQRLKTWKWSFGKTPSFCKKINLGKHILKLNIEHGRVVKIYESHNFERLQNWITSKKPKYIKYNFFKIPKHFTVLEQKVMQILFDTIPEVPK